MADFKVTYIFRAKDVGWTESYYRSDTNIAEASVQAAALAVSRAQLLGRSSQVAIVGTRISRLDAPFGVAPDRSRYASASDLVGDRVDMPWIGILMSLQAANGRRRGLILRGVPDNITHSLPEDQPQSGAWRAKFNDFGGRLVAGSWSLRTLSTGLAPALAIADITADITGGLVVTRPVHSLSTGQIISWYRVDIDGVCLRGKRPIVRLSADTFRVTGYNVREILFRSGSFKLPVYMLSNIRTFVLGSKRRKKTGRPSGGLRGRQSAKMC